MSELQEQTSREALHQRIIDVAGEEFRKHGIRSVRMDDLSSLLGISKRTLYEEFEDKEAVLTAVFDHQIRRMEAVYAKNREESDEGLSDPGNGAGNLPFRLECGTFRQGAAAHRREGIEGTEGTIWNV